VVGVIEFNLRSKIMSFNRTVHTEKRMDNRAISEEAYDATLIFAKVTYLKFNRTKLYYHDKESLNDLKDAYPDIYERNYKALKNIEIRISRNDECDVARTVVRKNKYASKRH
jgi:hypothetical protein